MVCVSVVISNPTRKFPVSTLAMPFRANTSPRDPATSAIAATLPSVPASTQDWKG